MPATWTVLESFWSIEEAQMARGFLENQGIACQLENLAIAGNLWHLNNATGGVRLLVETENAQRAAKLLDEVEEAHRQRGAGQEDWDEGFDEDYGEPEDSDAEMEHDAATESSATEMAESDDVEDYRSLSDRMAIGKQVILFGWLIPLVAFTLLGCIMVLISMFV